MPLRGSGKTITPVLLTPELTREDVLAVVAIPLPVTIVLEMTPNYESSCRKGSNKENQARAR